MAEGVTTEKISSTAPEPPGDAAASRRALTPAAARALAEADLRRRQSAAEPAHEHGGRGGLEPVRYGDWEVKGLASDF